MMTKVGVMIPIVVSDERTWPTLLELVTCVEAEGLDSVWFGDHFFVPGASGDALGVQEAWTLMTAVAASTKRVQVGAMVLCATFRNPGLLANMAVAFDYIAPKRLILGVGAGNEDPEHEAYGFPTDHRVSRFEEWIEILVRLLRKEAFSFEGTYYGAHNSSLIPPPANPIPVQIGSRKPRMHALAARWADSWNLAWYGMPDQRLETDLREFEEILAANGRARSTIDLTIGIVIHGPDSAPGHLGVPDSVDHMAAAIRAYAERGFNHVVALNGTPTVDWVKRLAEAARTVR